MTAYAQERGLHLNTKVTLLNFYVNDYCKGRKVREIIFKGFNTQFDAMYCDKEAVLLLLNKMPIAIVHNE